MTFEEKKDLIYTIGADNPYKDAMLIGNHKVTAAKLAIQNSFVKLLQFKLSSSVSVTEICKNAYVARSTFYACYSNIESLLLEVEDSFLAELIEKILTNNDVETLVLCDSSKEQDLAAKQDCLKFITTFLEENSIILNILFENQSNNSFSEKLKGIFKFYLWYALKNDIDPANLDISLELVASLMLTCCEWGKNHSDALDMNFIFDLTRAALANIV